MSIVVRFSPEGLTADRYDEVKRRLADAGQWPGDGLEYHLCFGEDGQLRISEIWSSPEQLEAYVQHLMPVINEVGVTLAGPPEVLGVYNQERF